MTSMGAMIQWRQFNGDDSMATFPWQQFNGNDSMAQFNGNGSMGFNEELRPFKAVGVERLFELG